MTNSESTSSLKTYRYLGWLTAAYMTFQLVSDVTAGKIIQIGNFPVSVTVLYFPFTYIFGDVLTEVYGYAEAEASYGKFFSLQFWPERSMP